MSGPHAVGRWTWSVWGMICFSAVGMAQTTPPEGDTFFFTAPGASQPGRPVTASGPDTGTLHIHVREQPDEEPTPCRIAVVSLDGQSYYQPPSNYLSRYSLTGVWPQEGAWGNRPGKAPYRYLGHYFYTTGETTLQVPAGQVRIEVAKGFEIHPISRVVSVRAGQETDVSLVVVRTARMAEHGYFGGDPHLHFARQSERDEQTILDLLAAEDVWFGTPLGYNEPAGPYSGVMEKMDSPQLRHLGQESIRTRGNQAILSGQEYRSVHFGHLNLYLLPKLVFAGESFNLDDGPAYGVVGEQALKDGGYAIHAHGGYAKEIYADAALGAVSAVELLQFGIYRELGLAGWYDMLNSGYRFPAVGASDFPACRFMSDCRTYVRPQSEPLRHPSLGPPDPPPFAAWMRGLAEGRSFITTGPLLLLEVDGHHPGDVVQRPAQGAEPVKCRIRVRCEVTPVSTVDLIVNGEVVHRATIPRDQQKGKWFEVTRPVSIPSSAWITARAWSVTPGGQPDAEAHTNPVYLDVAGRRVFQRAALDRWVAKIDGQMAIHSQRKLARKAEVLAYFQRARDTLLAIREQGGLGSDETPGKRWADRAAGSAPAAARLDWTADELRKFLQPVPPKSPAESLQTFETAPGFHVELVAAEPLVRDPVAAALDEEGQLYVCEMRDYPFLPAAGQEPIGSVKLLRDTDGDGDFDEGHLFADKLLWAAGVVPWRGGVFVAAPPDILYLRDTDGDFRADVRRRVFTGFGTANQQAMVNNLQWGLDHWIYGTTAGNGGTITRVADERSVPVPVTGRDFRFDPETERFEAITGTVQFGNTFDDWGRRFTCSESQPLLHIVQPDHYLARNPFLAAPGGVLNIAPGPVAIHRISPVERWRQVRSLRRIAKQERAATSPGASHHVIDAAAGATVYRGGAYPPEMVGQVFVGDGQNNLVHRRRLIPDGVTFRSERVDDQSEFVRSSDIWFRPVNFVNAPDGTLYCLDMCREVLESIHIPLDVAGYLDFASGRDHGRIYRLAPDGMVRPQPPRLRKASGAELVGHLASPHGWWRDTAQRLLLERRELEVVPALREMARKAPLPQARLHALWTLQGLGSLDDETLLGTLRGDHPRLREHAVRLSEPRLAVRGPLQDAVLALTRDPDAGVLYQVAFSLGESRDPRAADALADLARRLGSDRWMRVAILSSAGEFAGRLAVEFVREQNSGGKPVADAEFLRSLAALVGVRGRADEVTSLLAALAAGSPSASPSAIDPLLLALGRGSQRAGQPLTSRLSSSSREATAWFQAQLAAALRMAADSSVPVAQRLPAVELLGFCPGEAIRERWLELLGPEQPSEIQLAVVQATAYDLAPQVTEALLERWNSFTPDVRRAAVDVLLGDETRTQALLEAAERGEVTLSDLEPVRRDGLLKHRQERIRGLANRIWGATTARSRQAVVREYEAALQAAGKAEQGKGVFAKNCANCHQLGGVGFAVGPNLASTPSRDPQALLTHILDPNHYVLPNYVQYLLQDKQGRSFTGLISAQTSNSVTLKKDRDTTLTILRSDIEELVSTGKSLMPEELEKSVTVAEMADLIAYLQQSAKVSADPEAERDFGTLPGLVEPARPK